MIPKISKFYYYFYSENPHSLIQLIAEANDFYDDQTISKSQLELIQKHQWYCQILNTIEFTIESYGIINFFTEYVDLVSELPSLSILLKEFRHSDIATQMNQAISFYENHLSQFELLRNPAVTYNERDAIKDVLNSEFNSYFDLSKPMKYLAEQIKNDPDNFCLDEEGKSLERGFTGQLETYYTNKNLQKKYSFLNGMVYGECLDFDFEGREDQLYFYKNEHTTDLLKQWFKNGNLKYEKYSDDSFKYWHENGQIHIERNGPLFQKWDENGNSIE